MTEEKCPQLVDYFVVAGLDPAGPWRSLDEDGKTSTSSSSTTSSSLSGRAVESVTDLTVIARGLGEEVPEGFTCIERTLGGHSAELSAGLINNPHLYLCYRRGRDKPPILDLGWDFTCRHSSHLPGDRGDKVPALKTSSLKPLSSMMPSNKPSNYESRAATIGQLVDSRLKEISCELFWQSMNVSVKRLLVSASSLSGFGLRETVMRNFYNVFNVL